MEMVGEVCPHCRVGRMKAFMLCKETVLVERQEKVEAVVRCDSLQCDGYLTISPWQNIVKLENPLRHLPPASHGHGDNWQRRRRGSSLSSSGSTHSPPATNRLLTSCSSFSSTSNSSIKPSHHRPKHKSYEQLKSSGPRWKGPWKSSAVLEKPLLCGAVDDSHPKNPHDPEESIDSQFLDDLLNSIELESTKKESNGLQYSTDKSTAPSYSFTDDELMNLWMDNVDSENKASVTIPLNVKGSQDRPDEPLAVLSNSDLNILDLTPVASSPPCQSWEQSVVSEAARTPVRDCTTPFSSIDVSSSGATDTSQVLRDSFGTPVDSCNDVKDYFPSLDSKCFSSPAASAASEDSGYNEDEGKLIPLFFSDALKVSPVYPPTPLFTSSVKNSKAAVPSLPQEDSLKHILLPSSSAKQPSPELQRFSVHPALITAGKCAVKEEDEGLQQNALTRPLSQEESMEPSSNTVEGVGRGVDLVNNNADNVDGGVDLSEETKSNEEDTSNNKSDSSNIKNEQDTCVGSGVSTPSIDKVPNNEDISEVSSQCGSVAASDCQESSRASCSDLSVGEAASPLPSGSSRDVQKKGKGRRCGKRRGQAREGQAVMDDQNRRNALGKEAESSKRARATATVSTRQTRQRTGSIEVQAPSRDPVPISGRRGLSSLLQGSSWQVPSNTQICQNVTNLSLRSLLTVDYSLAL